MARRDVERLGGGVGSVLWLRDNAVSLRAACARRFRAAPSIADELDSAFAALVAKLNDACSWDPS